MEETLLIDLGQDFYDFVVEHRYDDPVGLRLKLAGKEQAFPLELALIQIEARRKAGAKLGPFFDESRFLVPTVLSSEQATDWRVARHHASNVNGLRVLDLTAGLGIDVMSMAMGGAYATAVELEGHKCEILKHNASVLGLAVNVIEGDANEVIKSLDRDAFDIVYIDPARRDGDGRRTYAFADCQPDITFLLPLMLAVAPKVIIKASPLLDLTAVMQQLPEVSAVEVVSVKGEVKELLITIDRKSTSSGTNPDVVMTCLRADGAGDSISVKLSDLGAEGVDYALDSDVAPGKWLCEPDAALMKCAPWGELCRRNPGLRKISRDTHLFIAEERPAGFPGRCVPITALPDRRRLKSLAGSSINVATRNYPGGTDTLRKRLRLTDGGEDFIYGFRTVSGRPLIAYCKNGLHD